MGASFFLSGIGGHILASIDLSKGMVSGPIAHNDLETVLGKNEDIDWQSLARVNDDIAGWLRIEGTAIDCPVPIANVDEPDFYLTHDFAGEKSWQGHPYLDARCNAGAQHLMILGHNAPGLPLGFGFLAAGYLPENFMQLGHMEWTTPGGSQAFEPFLALQVDASNQEIQRFAFIDDAEFADWFESLGSQASAYRKGAVGTWIPNRVLTLVTCSTALQDETKRTVVMYGAR